MAWAMLDHIVVDHAAGAHSSGAHPACGAVLPGPALVGLGFSGLALVGLGFSGLALLGRAPALVRGARGEVFRRCRVRSY